MAKLKSEARIFIADMGIGHLFTNDSMWIEIAHAKPFVEQKEFMEFNSMSKAQAFVADCLLRGAHVQPIAFDDIPWDKPDKAPFDSELAPRFDWEVVKSIVQEVLEKAKSGSEAAFQKEAKKMGVSYEEFLAAAITQLVSQEIEEQAKGD